ncbi:hypothetical protein BH09MYX1_BH09MYX1_62880 [soil metagenome]
MRKMAILGGAFMTLVLMAGSTLALAEGPHHGHDPAAMVQRFDTNKDGKLQVSELPERLKERLGKADTNGDGVITEGEITAHRAQMKAARFAKADTNKDGGLEATEVGARWARIQVADTNKDGKVTMPELDAARAAGQIQHGHGGRGHRGQ